MHQLPYWRLSGYYFFYFAFVGIFSPYFGLYLQSLSFSAWDIGLLMSQMQLMRLAGPYLWGALADRLGQRVSIIRLAGLLSLLGFSAFFFARSFEALLVVMALMAFFWSAALPLVETLTFDHLRDAPTRYSRIRMWGSIGFIVAVIAGGALLDHWPLPSLLWAIFATLAGILLCGLLIPDAPARHHEEAPVSVGSILAQPRVRALFAACFIMSAAHGALYVFYSIYLSAYGYSTSLVGALWSLGVVAEIVVFFFMSRWLQRYGLRLILLAAFFAAVIRFMMIAWGVEYLWVIVLAQVLHGLTFGAYHAASIAAVNRWFPGPCQARGQALYSSLSFGAGGLVGGLLSGWTWDWLGPAHTFTLSAAFALVGLLLVTAWVRDGVAPEPPPAPVVP